MKIATFNVNGISARLPALLRWLAESKPDVACLQELKAPQEKFPEAAIRAAGYGVVWHGQKSWNGVAILARGADPVESRRSLPGDPEDKHSRYIEALINGVLVGCLYLPNGNPAPGPKFDYKLRWLERLTKHAEELLATPEPVVLAPRRGLARAVADAVARQVVRNHFDAYAIARCGCGTCASYRRVTTVEAPSAIRLRPVLEKGVSLQRVAHD